MAETPLVHELLRQLLTQLTYAEDEGKHADAADDILLLLTSDRDAAGRTMLAMASFTMYLFIEEREHIEPQDAIEALTGIGDPIDDFDGLLQALYTAYRDGEKINERAILLAARITHNPDDAAIVLWALGTYLAHRFNHGEDEPETAITHFVDSCVRQEIVLGDRELRPT